MRYTGPAKSSETASPPSKRRTPPSEQTEEAPGQIESEQVDVEREAPLEERQSIERIEPREGSEPPVFED
jgi:hypothetical protein